MKYFLPILLFIFLKPMPVVAQLSLQMGQQFLKGQNIIKLEVSPEDYTIWALTKDQKIYYKKPDSADFELYIPMQGKQVRDMAGYNFNEMFFLTGPNQIIRIKDGVSHTFSVTDPLVNYINDIAISSKVYGFSEYAILKKIENVYLAIGTNSDLFVLEQGIDSLIKVPTNINNTEAHFSWDYLRTGFKGATFRFNEPYIYCTKNSNHVNYNLYSYTNIVRYFFDLAPMPTKVNTGLMSLHPFNGDYNSGRILDFWGTDEGLYSNYNFSCTNHITTHYFTDKVNGISEAYAFSQINPQQYILAATDHGLKYDTVTVFGNDTQQINTDNLHFVTFKDFPDIEANDVLVDSRKDPEPTQLVFVCDRMAWVATIDGIFQIYLNYDGTQYQNVIIGNILGYTGNNITPTYTPNGDAIFNRCNDSLSVNAISQFSSNSAIKISWYKDSVEIPEWRGLKTVQLKQSGTYQVVLTSLCENVNFYSNRFVLQSAPEPQITFTPPPKVNLCEGGTYDMSTLNVVGYTYQWYRNNQKITNANTAKYTATQNGTYKVAVSACGNYFKMSDTTQVQVHNLLMPVIFSASSFYCKGTWATLSITNSNHYATKWYLNGMEIDSLKDKDSFETKTSGNYVVKINDGYCEKTSDTYNLQFNEPINFEILKSKEGALCYGENVTLKTSIEADSYLWSTGETTRDITVNKSGLYTVQIVSSNICLSSQSAIVNILPPVSLDSIPDTTICTISNEKLQINAPKGFTAYQWSGDGISSSNDYIIVSQPGIYHLMVTTSEGCTAENEFEVKTWCKELIIPNTFTPNNDGINDTWHIDGLENDPAAEVKIIDRYGNILLDRNGQNFEWDGTIKGTQVPEGTYYYIINTKNSNKPLTGSLLIIK